MKLCHGFCFSIVNGGHYLLLIVYFAIERINWKKNWGADFEQNRTNQIWLHCDRRKGLFQCNLMHILDREIISKLLGVPILVLLFKRRKAMEKNLWKCIIWFNLIIYIYIYREREREREREIYNYYLSKGIVTEYVPWACRVQERIKSKLLCWLPQTWKSNK